MKKIFALLLICLSIFCLSSCEILFAILGGISTDPCTSYTEADLEDGRDYYLIQYNWTNDKMIPANYTAYVDYENSRSVEKETPVEVENPEAHELIKYSSEYTDKLLRDEMSLVVDSGRSAGIYKDSKILDTKTVNVGSKKAFYVFGSSSESDIVSYDATCKYVNNDCNVWYIDNNREIEVVKDFESLAAKFSLIKELLEEIYGSHTYSSAASYVINPKNKIDIVVYDIFGDASASQRGGTFGYFRPYDMIKNGVNLNGEYINTSNQTEAIFIDSYFYNLVPNMVYSTIAHEYTHLLNFVTKSVKNDVAYSTWYTEMMAMLSEDMLINALDISYSDSPWSRLEQYKQTYNYGPTAWYENDYVLISYANAFALGADLVRNHGGFNTLKSMAQNKYGDIDSINSALGSNTGFDDLIANHCFVILNNSLYYNKLGSTNNKYKSSSGKIQAIFDPIDITKNYTNKNSAGYRENTYPELWTATGAYRKDIGPNGFVISEVSENNGYETVGIRYCAGITDIWNMYLLSNKRSEWVFEEIDYRKSY